MALAAPALAADLPDDRSYELISPGDNGAVADVNVLPFIRPSDTGDRVAFQVLGDVRTGPSTTLSTYLATRGDAGWSSTKITPPTAAESHQSPNYTLYGNVFYRFTSDLSKAVFVGQPNPPLTATDPANKANAYIRDNTTGAYRLITDREPTPLQYSNQRYATTRIGWTSSDLSEVVFDSEGSAQKVQPDYFPGAGGSSVYAWNKRDGMSVASVLPNGRYAGGAMVGAGPRTSVGTRVGAFVDSFGGDKNAVSADGSRIFFTAGAEQLFVRKNHGTPQASTDRIDAPEPGQPPATTGESNFLTATDDGHRVLFSSCNQLTAGSTAVKGSGYCRDSDDFPNTTAKADLYIRDEDANGGAGDLIDLTTGDSAGADVVGVLGANADLTRVYFAARGNLAPGIPAERPQDHVYAGDPKLYVWDATDGVRFIARMRVRSPNYYFNIRGDIDAWRPSLGSPTRDAAVSTDGGAVAWGTQFPVDTTYNNLDPQTGDPHKEVYTYDYDARTVKCVSCVGTGPARSDASVASQRLLTGEAGFPNYPDYERHNLVAGGTQLYFETAEKLLPDDMNLVNDVYQYRTDTGALALISSGRSGRDSNFLGATEDGQSVFLRTTEGLVNADRNQNSDLYVARSNSTVRDDPEAPAPCAAGCPAPPATSTFTGPSNVARPRFLQIARIGTSQRTLFARSGRLSLGVTAPAAGKVSARVVAQFGRKLKKTAGSAAVVARGPGKVTVVLRLSGAARRQLLRTGRLGLRIEVTAGTQKRVTHLTLVKRKPKSKRKGGGR